MIRTAERRAALIRFSHRWEGASAGVATSLSWTVRFRIKPPRGVSHGKPFVERFAYGLAVVTVVVRLRTL
jgi:hypothetical protein